MEIRNLSTFLKVADMKSFTKAGKELGYSQSNISAQIQQMERELGHLLFNRIGKRVSLTQFGEEILPHARQIVSTALQIENLSKSGHELRGTVRIGMVESLFGSILEETVIEFHKKFSCVKLEVTADATEALKEQLKKGILDVACIIDNLLPRTDWNCLYAADVPVVLISNPVHPLARKKNVKLEELEGEEWVLMEESASYSICFQNLMAERKIEINSFLKMQNADMACRLVQKDAFLSVLPLYTVQPALKRGDICIISCDEFVQRQAVQIVAHKNKVIIPQIEGIVKILESKLKSLVNM